jgi:hypothetical protein
MDSLQKVVATGPLSYMLSADATPDLCAWTVFNTLPGPISEIKIRNKCFFGLAEVDSVIGGISGLWELHGPKSSGKTYFCTKLAVNAPGRVLYLNYSPVLCCEFRENV